MEVDGQRQARPDREGTIGRRGTSPGCLEATGQTYGRHTKVGKDAEEIIVVPPTRDGNCKVLILE